MSKDEDDEPIETAKATWRAQGIDAPPSIDYLRSRALDHTERSRSRSVIEYLLGGTAALMCIWFAAKIDSALFRVGAMVMLAGILYGLYESWRRRMTWSVTLEGSALDGLSFYKRELQRLRDLHRSLWKVYLPAGIPGAIVLLVWTFVERPETGNSRKVVLTVAIVVWILVTLRHEAREAQRYQRELDALSKNG